MKVLRKIIEIDEELCNGCGQCVPACAEGALEIIDGKAKVIADLYCDGLGACLGECPTGALKIVERQADDFDEAAVEELLKRKKTAPKAEPIGPPAGGCPSARLQTFLSGTPANRETKPAASSGEASNSALSHWPVQMRLVPPSAPFLKNADLLVAADCVPIAYRNFHGDFLAGKTVLLGCPKFDDADSYVNKLAAIFQEAEPRSITLAIMEVPCCGNMRVIVQEALKRSGKPIPVQEAVIGVQGEILRKADWRNAA